MAKKKSERMQLADLLVREQRIQQILDVFKHPVAAMVAGVSAINFLFNKVRDQDGNPVLFSDAARGLMQTSAIAYPLFAGGQGSTKEKLGVLAAGGLVSLLAGSELSQTAAEGAEVYGDITLDRAEKGATFLPGPGITYMP